MKKSYSDQLLDPRWQKKRLQILERDKWTCQKCSDTGATLHVHHKKYLTNTDPWDYPDEFLTSLCELCHTMAGNKEIDFNSVETFTCRSGDNIFKVIKCPDKEIMVIGGQNNNYYPLFISNEALDDLIKFLNN
jgi:hypothetical protein